MRRPVPEQHRAVTSHDIGQLDDPAIGGVEKLRRGYIGGELEGHLIARGCSGGSAEVSRS